jgi:ParB family chromosome partitioning protein
MAARKSVPAPDVAPSEASVVDAIAAPTSGPRLIDVDPKTLEIAGNIRSDVKLDRDLVNSIKLHGVLVPILIEDTGAGTYRVVDGQRRTIHAAEAGIATIPAVVQPKLADADRTVEQLVVNDQREQLTEKDRANGYKQLALDFGLTPDQIARRTGAKRDRVKVALAAVGSSDVAVALLERGEMEAAARVAALGPLTDEEHKTLRGGADPWRISQVEKSRAEKKQHEEWAALAAERGLQFIAERTSTDGRWGGKDSTHQAVDILIDKATGEKLTAATHAGCPGLALSFTSRSYGEAQLVEVCSDPKKYGHVVEWKYRKPKTAEEIAAAKAEKEAKENAAIAAVNRRAWIKNMLTGGLPDGWVELVADVAFEVIPGAYSWEGVAAELLDVDPGDYAPAALREWLKAPARVGSRKPQIALLAHALASIEALVAAEVHAHSSAAGYLTLLVKWGYELTDFERGIVKAGGTK